MVTDGEDITYHIQESLYNVHLSVEYAPKMKVNHMFNLFLLSFVLIKYCKCTKKHMPDILGKRELI